MGQRCVIIDTKDLILTDRQALELAELEFAYKQGLFTDHHLEAEVYNIVGKSIPVVFGDKDVISNS